MSLSDVLERAAKYGHLNVVLSCLRADIRPKHSLCKAAKRGHLSIVEALLRDGRFEADRTAALEKAAQYGYTEIVALLASQVDPTVKAFKSAVQNGQTETVAYLLTLPPLHRLLRLIPGDEKPLEPYVKLALKNHFYVTANFLLHYYQ